MIELTGYRDKHEYVNKHGVKSVVYLMDCMEAMAQMGDKEFSLLVADPPYGLDVANMNMGAGKGKRCSKIKNRKWTAKDWDKAPQQEYFHEAFRVTVNQIIWGGNYFNLPPFKNFIVWDKEIPDGLSFADCELAWTSFNMAAKIFRYSAYLYKAEKMHPTQKPVALYDWIFHNYSKPNDTIFDSHLGSGSSRIAADKHNLPFLGTETDDDYFYAHCKRFDRYTAQLTLF
jgi:site-specific DNA-methyltransferase (adenine-specific)